MSGVEHFWTPPRPGEQILGMIRFEGWIVVATTDGIYTIGPQDRVPDDWVVRKVSDEMRKTCA